MRFTQTEMSGDLQDAARKLLARDWPVEAAKRYAAGDAQPAESLWEQTSLLGWPGIAVPGDYGGGDGSLLDLCAVAEEMGRAVAPTHLYSTALAAEVVRAFGTSPQKEAFLPRLAEGSLRAAVALDEPALTSRPEAACVQAARDGGWVLNGTQWFVADASAASILLVPANLGAGRALFIVPKDAEGVTIADLSATTGPGQSILSLSDVRLDDGQAVGAIRDGEEALRLASEWAQCLQLADVIGVCSYVLDKTVAYVKQRVAFGVPIGSFQAVQHHLANMAMDFDCAELLSFEAIELVTRCDEEGGLALSRAQSFAPTAIKRATLTAHQLHGGAGEVLEDDLYLYSNRAKRAELTLGTRQMHLEAVAERLGKEAVS